MAAPRSITAYTLNALKGWPSMTALDYSAPFASSVFSIVTEVLPGSVVHVNRSG